MGKRRDLLALASAILTGWPTPSSAQDDRRVRRIAYLGTSDASRHLAALLCQAAAFPASSTSAMSSMLTPNTCAMARSFEADGSYLPRSQL